MERGRSTWGLVPLLLAASCGGGAERPESLLLVTLDTVRADAVGHLGEPGGLTPAIDRLAAEGVAFVDAWTPRGQTWPALATLLTGRHPLTHGVRENGFQLPAAVPSLVEVFRRAGFRTGAFLSNACEAWGERFDYLACTQGPGELDGDQSRLQHAWDARAVEGALAWIGDGSQPFLAWVHLYDAHKPFPTVPALRGTRVDAGYRGPWRAGDEEAAAGHRMRVHELVDAACLSGERPAEGELAALRAHYEEGVAGVDAHVGALLDALRARGVLDSTLVVLTADHGEELFDHGNYPYHGAAIHGSTLRVPLVLAWPAGLPAGARVAAPVELADVAPTVLELFDLAAPGPLEGASLLPLVAGGTRERDLAAELVALDLRASPPAIDGELHALRRGRWRLVWNPDGLVVRKPPFPEGDGGAPGLLHRTALYDLERDPGETVDVAGEHPDVAAELRAALETRLERLRARAARAAPPSPELVETLRSLGYVGDPR